jgi:uncharacterized protein YbjT (DUF2867 family)
MYVVAGTSGNTGKVVASTLLSQKKSVRVVVRDAKKGESWKERGAEVAIAELDDSEALASALRGAEGAYLLLPPQMASISVRADNAKRAQSLAKAIDASGVKHVVFLSSIASQHAQGTGPIVSTHDAEALLGKARGDVTFLRAAYFMENWGASLYALGEGKLPTFLLEGRAFPMVATLDIGTTAAKLLVEGGRGKRIVELAGPREYSPQDVAAALSRIVGRTVTAEQGPEEAMIGALTSAGLNGEWARLFQELTHGLNTGHVDWEKGQPRVRGVTEIEVVLRGLLGK